MKKDIKNIEASVRARLQNEARATNRPFSEILAILRDGEVSL